MKFSAVFTVVCLNGVLEMEFKMLFGCLKIDHFHRRRMKYEILNPRHWNDTDRN